ncbi:MAG: hypothetical protein QOK48_3656, partial [Blastocatellia bacterium]|nr:hypothetical protein [Blastocatellia bacterium]
MSFGEHKTGAAVLITPNRAWLRFPKLRRGSSRDMLIKHARNCLLGGSSDDAL